MPAVHRGKDFVRSRLHRQMQERHESGLIAMRPDEAGVHVVWMARRIADTRDAGHLGKPRGQHGQGSGAAFRRFTMIGIDILSKEAHLAHPRGGKLFDLGGDAFNWPRRFGAPRIRHDTEGAEFIAAFLHRHKGRDPAFADFAGSWRGRGDRTCFRPENRCREPRAGGFGAAQKLRQAMIALRSDNDINGFLAAENFFPFGLRDTARDDNFRRKPCPGAGGLELAQLAQFGEDLLGGALPDMARVQDDNIGLFQKRRLGIAFRRENIRHLPRIIDIHLTAVRLHEQPAGGFCRSRVRAPLPPPRP